MTSPASHLPVSVPATPAPAAPVIARPIASPAEMIAAHEETTALINQALSKGVDFGEIPGTDKPTLLQPGAQRLCIAFGVRPTYEIVEQEVDHNREVPWSKRKKVWNKQASRYDYSTETGTSLGLYRFVVRCRLVRPDGLCLGEAVGSCSTMESKYVDRPRECENTALKMAQKRALIGAVLSGFGLSNRFGTEEEHDDAPVGPDEIFVGTDRQVRQMHAYLQERRVDRALWPTIEKEMKGKAAKTIDSVVAQAREQPA